MWKNCFMSTSLESQFASALAALTAIAAGSVAYTALTDSALLDLTRLCSQVQRAAGTHSALIAGEVARRSSVEHGQAGLAQASGYRTPEELIRSTTGSTVRDAKQAVRVGLLAWGGDSRSWLAPVGAAVVDDGLSLASADSISNGLGAPSDAVTADELSAAAQQLCEEATTLDADRLYRRACALRDELDAAGIAERESSRHDERALRFFTLTSGMSRLIWNMDPETAAVVAELYDRATSPKLGGPRFVEPGAAALSNQIFADARSIDQLASDTFLHLLQAGADADSSQLLGSGAPSIRVLVTEAARNNADGYGRIEGQSGAVSIQTIERLSCEGGIVPVTFDQGQPLDVGREQRLYTRRQRIALAARDGGCRWPGCERPPSWTESHHIKHWARDDGRTDVADGILLCKHHHLLAHNYHWEIERVGADYWLVPPPDRHEPRRLMPSKSAAMGDLQREASARELVLT
jgi:hypothetical protein